MKGSSSNVVHFGWTEEYDDLINRFESYVDIEDIKTIDDLYEGLHDWLGVSKRDGSPLPNQKQMDLFSEYYEQPFYDVKAYERQVYAKEQEMPSWEYGKTRYYNPETKVFTKPVYGSDKRILTFTHHTGVIKTYHFNKRMIDVEVIVDKKTGKILAWHKDITHNKYYGSQY
jgi:hypothetical protein